MSTAASFSVVDTDNVIELQMTDNDIVECKDEPILDDDDVDDDNNDQSQAEVTLERLPRPVDELNCRMARSYLVKLLRAANGGLNPAYGNPEKRPPFWPDFYWPWAKLTDVHTKPRDMAEPLNYSEMMKLAIERGYQFFGYDPKTYVDRTVDLSENRVIGEDGFPPAGRPPKLNRPLTKLNCVQTRSCLSKLLRYQHRGSNPVYGSADTKPPWWPEDLVKWRDMVDLRAKPKYIADQKSFTDILKKAIERAINFYGENPDTYVEESDTEEEVKEKPVIVETPQNLPPRLSAPFTSMNCAAIRAALSKLIWFYNNNIAPNYGNPHSMPSWWPQEMMDWRLLKNLRHKYEGPLGGTYTNCLRTALRRGYAHYGVDIATYHSQQQRTSFKPSRPMPPLIPLQEIKFKRSDSEILRAFQDDFRCQRNTDACFIATEDGTKINVHRSLLSCRSPRLADLFRDMDGGECSISVDGVSGDVLALAVECLYFGEVKCASREVRETLVATMRHLGQFGLFSVAQWEKYEEVISNEEKNLNRKRKGNVECSEVKKAKKSSPKAQLDWLHDLGILEGAGPCVLCGSKCELVAETFENASWLCPKASAFNKHSQSINPTLIAELRTKNRLSLSEVNSVILHWTEGKSEEQCREMTGCEKKDVKMWYEECEKYINPKKRS